MTIEETIGWRMRYRREYLRLTQKEVGLRLGEHLGRAWAPQAVSIAESGGRDFRAADLEAIARVLETTPNFLMNWETPPDADTVNRLQSLYRDIHDAWIRLSAAVRWLQTAYRDPATGEPTFVLGEEVEEILVVDPDAVRKSVAERTASLSKVAEKEKS